MTHSLTASRARTEYAPMGEESGLTNSGAAGVQLTAAVSRYWSGARTPIAATMIMTLVSAAEGQRLVAEYVERGGGLAMSQPAEKAAFLAFLAARLPYPSHALTLCHMAQALSRAQSGADAFVEPGIRTIRARADRALRDQLEREAWGCVERGAPARAEPEVRQHIESELRKRLEREAWQCIERAVRGRIERGQHASLVWFHAEPAAVIRALDGAAAPTVGGPAHPLLFAPGLPNLYRVATAEEAALWARLPTDDVEPERIEQLLAEGAVTYAD